MRAALSELQPEFAERDFFRQKFSAEELRALAGPWPIAGLFAARSPSVKKLGLDPPRMSKEEMLEWMLKEPRLIKRPLVKVDGELLVQPNARQLEDSIK